MAIVLPDSVFDTSENRYIRLFLYKHFFIRAIISLPQTTFEPYTKTKTSIIFAQKKTSDEIKSWGDAWAKYRNEYSRLATKIANYKAHFLEGKVKSKFPSIRKDTDAEVVTNIQKLLRGKVDVSDLVKKPEQVLLDYEAEIEKALKKDLDAGDGKAKVNSAWVFAMVSKEASYPFILAGVERIGFKRSKVRNDDNLANDLFSMEWAPSKLDVALVLTDYESDIAELSNKITKDQGEVAKLGKKAIVDTDRIEFLDRRIENSKAKQTKLIEEKALVEGALRDIYNKNGKLKNIHSDRADTRITEIFSLPRMEKFRSEEVLMRQGKTATVLDEMRQRGLWK